MTKAMDLEGNGRLDWFFDEWVYGTQVPRYRFDYQLVPADGGKVKLHMTVTQSEVDAQFAMLVPLFADFGKRMVRLGQIGISGNTTKSGDVVRLLISISTARLLRFGTARGDAMRDHP